MTQSFYRKDSSDASDNPLDQWAELPIWVAWKELKRNGKTTKTPLNPEGGNASSIDPATWGTRAEAEMRSGRSRRIGVVLGQHDGFALGGIDLDSCLDPDTGRLAPWASEVVERFASYAEVSPSGEGVKVFFKYDPSDLPRLRSLMGTEHSKSFVRGEHYEIAMHLGGRYFTVTGDAIGQAPDRVRRVGAEVPRWLIEDAGPRFVGASRADKAVKDESRSGRAFRLAKDFKNQGGSERARRTAFEAALADDVELAAWAKDERQVDRAWNRAPDIADEFEDLPPAERDPHAIVTLDEAGVIEAFTKARKDELRFDHTAGSWFRFDGNAWRREETKLALHYARTLAVTVAERDKKAKALRTVRVGEAIERGARTVREFAVTSAEWNADDWLLGTPGGTVDLTTGKLRPGNPDDRISRLTAVAPIPLDRFDAERDCPLWLRFLDVALNGDAEAIRFLQQWAGYSVTGDTREHALVFVHGPGGYGKSTAINTLADVIGEYAINVATSTLTVRRHGADHPEELARLDGARFAYASETEKGSKWAENRIKEMTGGDRITARFMRQNSFTFVPRFKLTIVGNNAPSLSDVDAAIKRRFNILPFDHPPRRKDEKLPEKLRNEWPGILSWMIVGCLDWQRNGLVRPAVALHATEEYFAGQDTFGQWIDDCCQVGPSLADTTARLWESWVSYAQNNGVETGTKVDFCRETLQKRGFESIRDRHRIRGRGFLGIRVASDARFDDN